MNSGMSQHCIYNGKNYTSFNFPNHISAVAIPPIQTPMKIKGFSLNYLHIPTDKSLLYAAALFRISANTCTI
jgi:hypothetical protein